MDIKCFVINYKETTIDTDGVMNVECGTFDYGVKTLEEAKNYLIDVAQKKVDDFDEDDDKVKETWSEDKEYVRISYDKDTYEYFIFMITIPNTEPIFD